MPPPKRLRLRRVLKFRAGLEPAPTAFKEDSPSVFVKSFIRVCRGRLSWRPAVFPENFPQPHPPNSRKSIFKRRTGRRPRRPTSYETSFPYLLFSPNAPTPRTGRTRRRGTGLTSRPRAAGTLRRTVRSSFPHRATARWGPKCGPPIEFRFRLRKKVAATPHIEISGRQERRPLQLMG